MKVKIFVLLLMFFQINCSEGVAVSEPSEVEEEEMSLAVGAERLSLYLPLLEGKSIGIAVNHSARIGERHLVDTLLSRGVNIRKIFAPEHGFRGEASDGEKIEDGKDPESGLPILSLYGKTRKPSAEMMAGLDLIVFDIQDVGVRFYTFLSTMHNLMEACAKYNVSMLVLDRPNPNGHFVDGPVLDMAYQSFVGMHPIPVAHGMTFGEFAEMINGEGWLPGGRECALTVIPCANYDHQTFYELPLRPSPNLPNMRSIYLYPSLCFFEGTAASIGRGTDKQFQVIGHPDFPAGDYEFKPQPNAGSKYPPQEGKLCRGYDLSNIPLEDLQKLGRLDLSYLVDFYRQFPDKGQFFLKTLYIDKLAGGKELREQLTANWDEEQIRASWQPKLDEFKAVRKKYLLYPDFE